MKLITIVYYKYNYVIIFIYNYVTIYPTIAIVEDTHEYFTLTYTFK